MAIRPFSGAEHQPFEWGDGSAKAALLIHGFPGTPAEMRGLGQALVEDGWHVRGPLLPGLGPDIVYLAEKRREDWLQALRTEWEELVRTHNLCVLVGFSMGATLALHLARYRPPDKLVLIAPFWRLPGFLPRLVPLLRLVMPQMRPFKDANFDDPKVRDRFEELMPGVDLDDPKVRTYLREEVTLPMAVVHEVLRLGAAAYRLAHSVSIPTLVIQGRDDELVRPTLTRKLVRRLGMDHVTYQEVPGDHELIQDGSEHKAEVLGLIIDYLREGL